jgi:PBP1b-binding outer membrane lipoprotein LpoB
MNIKKIIVITGLALITTGCFEEEDVVEVNNPQSMEDCIPINNPNKRDQCKMKVTALLNKKGAAARKKSLGSPDF